MEKTMLVGNINEELKEEVLEVKGRIIHLVDNFFPCLEEGCIVAVKKMTNNKNLLVHLDINKRSMSFEAISIENYTEYSPLFLLNELEDSFLKKVEIRKTKNFKDQIPVIEESLNLAYPILDILNNLFF